MKVGHTIKSVLTEYTNNPEGWFCLPKNHQDWTLETVGAFTRDSSDYPPNSDEYLPEEVRNGEWIVTIDNATIEDIVLNLKEQKENPNTDELLIAFVYYLENDAFLIL